jgi:predicted transcriptional regulator
MSMVLSTMRKEKVNDRMLLRLVDSGMSQSAAAKTLGVSRQAVSKRMQELRGRTTRAVVAKETQRALEQSFDAVDQLHAINRKTLELLDQAEKDGDFSLRCIAELRNQIRLAMDIQERIYNQQPHRNS